jgi:hypothetical protein
MAVYQKESGTAHGRGFSEADQNGFLAKLTGWMPRPAADGASQNFTATAATDVISCAGHGYSDLDIVRTTNSGGALPGGLAVDTDYWIIYIDANTFKLASTYGNAKADVAVDITSAGTGTHSVYKYGGGPAWYIREDKSNPTSQTFTADAGTDILTISAGHIHGTGDQIWVSNSGGALPTGLSASTTYYAIRVSSTELKLATSLSNAQAGTAINITSAGTGTHSSIGVEKYIVFCDTAAPTVNDISTGPASGAPKFVKAAMQNDEAGYVRIYYYLWWDTTAQTGYGLWCGYRINTSDDADFAYDFRGGAETMIIQSRIGTSWKCAGVSEFTGDAELLEGVDKFGILQSGITAGSSVVLQLDTGEAANFTVNNYYFIFDFDGHSWVNCVKVTAVDTGTDQVTIDAATYNFPTGAVIAAYAHRYVAFGNGSASSIGNIVNYNQGVLSKIPYINAANNSYVFHNQNTSIRGSCYGAVCNQFLDRVVPNRKGNWGTEDIYIVENRFENSEYQNETTGAREAYGVIKNVIATNVGTMAAGQDGRTDGGLEYLYTLTLNNVFSWGSSSYASLFLNSTSTS